MKKPYYTYKKSGVNIASADKLIKYISKISKKTNINGANSSKFKNIGSFGSIFDLSKLKFRNPVIVSSTDGVGTKLEIANKIKKFDTIGIDLVAMCVNDLIVQGAAPIFFLDYISLDKLNLNKAKKILRGIATGCKIANCALIGGETAEMPGVYQDGDFDLAGFCVGVVDYENIIDGKNIKPTDSIIGILSSGPHSNGYSLIRKIIELNSSNLEQKIGNRSLGQALIEPTTIYSRAVNEVNKNFEINGMVHITGGGFKENIVRILPDDVNAEVNLGSWTQPEVFDWIEEEGNVDKEEMLKTFNCGIGYILIVDKETTTDVIKVINNLGHQAFPIGDISAGNKEVRLNP